MTIEVEVDDDGPLVYSGGITDMPAPEADGISLSDIPDFVDLRRACSTPGYKIITARMEMHLFRIPCYRCKQHFMAWALYAPDGCRAGINWDANSRTFVKSEATESDVLALPGYALYIRALPPRVLDFLRHEIGAYPWTKVQASPGAAPYFANRCTYCNAIHGDHYLHLDGAPLFWPSSADGVRRVEFEPTYLIMYYGLFRPLRPSVAAMETFLDNVGMPDDGALMMGCAFCEWAAAFDSLGRAKPLSSRCDDCVAASPFLTAACAVVEQHQDVREVAFFQEN